MRQIANDCGVSDVAIHKRCTKLQVPTPPCGYWAKIEACKHPAKPALRAYSELVANRLRKRQREKSDDESYVRLSPLQQEFFERALALSGRETPDHDSMKLLRGGAQRLDGELAAELALVVQNNHMAWLKERAGDERINSSSIRSVKGLLAALLRVASSHVLVLHTEGSVFTVRTEGPTILIRLYPEFRQVIVTCTPWCWRINLNTLPTTSKTSNMRGLSNASFITMISAPPRAICVSAVIRSGLNAP